MTIKFSDLPLNVQVVAANLLASEIEATRSSWPERFEERKEKAVNAATCIQTAFVKLFTG